jgi:hypothetical protein
VDNNARQPEGRANILAGHEDDEDDDPAEDGGDTEPNGDEKDGSQRAEDEF